MSVQKLHLKQSLTAITMAGFSILWLFFGTACTKDPLGCFRSTGKMTTETRDIEAFDAVLMENNIDVRFIYTEKPEDVRVELHGGEKLLPKVRLENELYLLQVPGDSLNPGYTDSLNRLVIANDNQCNWVRSFEETIEARVYYHTLRHLEYRSVGDVNFAETLVSDTFRIDVHAGGGRINLKLNTTYSFLAHHYGTAEIHADGFSLVNYVFQASYGPVDARDLRTTYTYMENRSTNHTYIHTTLHLGVAIAASGNVYYSGSPTINLSGGGSGQLIRLE